MTLPDRLRSASELNAEGVRGLGEAVRSESERVARSDPSRLGLLFHSIRDASGCDPRLLPWTLWAEGTAEQLRGRPARAEPLLSRARRLFRRHGDSHTAARVDIALMDALACLGRHRSAARRGRRAVETLQAAGDRSCAAAALFNLGGLADARDQVRQALALWRRARRMMNPDDALRLGVIDGSLAGGLHALGRFREARELYHHASNRLHEAGARTDALQLRLGLAEVQALLGEVGQALTEIQGVESVAVEIEDDNLLFEARGLVARLELDLGHLDRSARLAEETIPRCERAGRRDDAARLAATRALAIVGGAEGDPEAALAAAEAALGAAGLPVAAAVLRVELARSGRRFPTSRLRRDATLLDRSGLVVQADLARLALAEALSLDGRPAAAADACRQVLRRRHVSVWPRMEAHRVLAETVADDDPEAAIHHLRWSVRLAESVRGRLSSEADRTTFAARHMSAYERLVELLLRRGDARSRRQAFDLVARVKSRGLLEALDRRRDLSWQHSPELVQRWNVMRQELGAMLAALEGQGGEGSRYATTAVAGRVREVARQLEDLELVLARSRPGLAVALGRVPPPRLRKLLAPDDLLLELFFAGPDLVVFELTRQGLRVTVASGVRDEVERRVEAIRFQISKAAYGRHHLEQPGAYLVNQTRDHLAALGDLVLSAVERRQLPGHLYVAPHGALHHLPFTALELGGEPLVAMCPVSVVPSSEVLAHVLARPRRRPRRIGIAGAAPAELPEIELEVAAVARRLPSATVVRNAGVADVCALLESCDLVHIASHGAFQPLCPAGSGLRLADGWLTALDLLQLPLGAHLVTVSACASGQVAVAPGEELMGVLRALLANGVRTAAVAPGVLDDEVARHAAELFYDHLFECGPGQALRRCLLDLRAEHPHPALWAALQLYGDPRPWEEPQ